MKLNISFNENISGYRNVNILKESVDLGNLDGVCGPSECREIIVSVLNYIPHNSLENVIRHLESRLRHGGKLVLLFNDVESLIRKYSIGEIDEIELNILLYGAGCKSVFSTNYISNILNINVSSIKVENGKVTIIAERP